MKDHHNGRIIETAPAGCAGHAKQSDRSRPFGDHNLGVSLSEAINERPILSASDEPVHRKFPAA